MVKNSSNSVSVRTAKELGDIIRDFRKDQKLTLEKISGLTRLGMRFLSELERGKSTAELGKTLEVLNALGLEVHIQARDQRIQLKKMNNEK